MPAPKLESGVPPLTVKFCLSDVKTAHTSAAHSLRPPTMKRSVCFRQKRIFRCASEPRFLFFLYIYPMIKLALQRKFHTSSFSKIMTSGWRQIRAWLAALSKRTSSSSRFMWDSVVVKKKQRGDHACGTDCDTRRKHFVYQLSRFPAS